MTLDHLSGTQMVFFSICITKAYYSVSWNGVDQLQILCSIKTGVLETSSFQKTKSQLYNTRLVLQMPD